LHYRPFTTATVHRPPQAPELPAGPTPAPEAIDLLAAACEPGLTATPSGRFYGIVTGGSHPAALA